MTIENLREEPRTVYRGKLTFDEFGARIKVQMRREHRELRHPEGDVAPRVFLYFAERVMEMQLAPDWFQSRGTKDALTGQIVKFINVVPLIGGVSGMGDTGVRYVGLVYGMFRLLQNFDDYTEDEREYVRRGELPPRVPMPSEHPESEEVLSVLLVDREIVHPWHALIQRHAKKSPRLGPWEDLGSGPPAGWEFPTGLMIDPIREAMR